MSERTESTTAASTEPTTNEDEEPVVSLENMSVEFTQSRLLGLAKSKTIRAVREVSMEIQPNEVIALVGESGCGKTTLGKAAIGLQRPTGGSVKYRGQDIWETKDQSRFRQNEDFEYSFGDIRKSLQIIHQDPESSLEDNATVLSILSEPLRRWNKDMTKNDRHARIFGFLEYVGLEPPEDYAHRFPHQLSGGEQQRVALVRSLLMNPDLILADESISALDVSLRIAMMDLMLKLQEKINTSYLFITHDISNARYITKRADGRIGIMYLGDLVEIGPVDQIINNPQHPYTKSLVWATPDFTSPEVIQQADQIEDAPLRKIDVPDAANPPSGCRFHTRCPEARETCVEQEPGDIWIDDEHRAACFRNEEDHEYWNSEEIGGAELEIDEVQS